jgi:hypothetical protein
LSCDGAWLRLLRANNEDQSVLLPVLRCLSNMALDLPSSTELRHLGAVPLLLSLIVSKYGCLPNFALSLSGWSFVTSSQRESRGDCRRKESHRRLRRADSAVLGR